MSQSGLPQGGPLVSPSSLGLGHLLGGPTALGQRRSIRGEMVTSLAIVAIFYHLQHEAVRVLLGLGHQSNLIPRVRPVTSASLVVGKRPIQPTGRLSAVPMDTHAGAESPGGKRTQEAPGGKQGTPGGVITKTSGVAVTGTKLSVTSLPVSGSGRSSATAVATTVQRTLEATKGLHSYTGAPEGGHDRWSGGETGRIRPLMHEMICTGAPGRNHPWELPREVLCEPGDP